MYYKENRQIWPERWGYGCGFHRRNRNDGVYAVVSTGRTGTMRFILWFSQDELER